MFSWMTLCDLCGYFDYHKSLFYNNFILGPPLAEEGYVYRKMQKFECSSTLLEDTLHDYFSHM